ncbi:MAG: PDC sensor domain-containing protein [Gammaproteobacteria bacterium]
MNHLNTVQRYRDYRPAIHDLLATTIRSLAEEWRQGSDQQSRLRSLTQVARQFPFISTVYRLDEQGRQQGATLLSPSTQGHSSAGDGADRSHRPYFEKLRGGSEYAVTEPYLSINNQALCLSSISRIAATATQPDGYIVMDVDLKKLLSFFMGDGRQRRIEPVFKLVYGLISGILFVVVGALLWQAGGQLLSVLGSSGHVATEQIFGVVIYLTLALAIFDLGKTTFEEEVLLGKDVFRHSSTRRTITRFIAAILIAISIESLMLIFKAALDADHALLMAATWVMMPAVGLLIGLGIYVYLGARAEKLLLDTSRRS